MGQTLSADLPLFEDEPEVSVVFDRAGLPVSTEGDRWKLNNATSPVVLDLSKLPFRSASLRLATRKYLREMIRTSSTAEVRNNADGLRLLFRSAAFVEADSLESVVPYLAVSEVRDLLGRDRAWRCHHIRKWYRWCADQGHPQFSPEVAFRLEELRFGGNAKAVAVLSADPEEGPLVDAEEKALLAALLASKDRGLLEPAERAALWLCVALGSNPMQLALLREEDFVTYPEADGGGTGYGIQVPRHKKGAYHARGEFRLRKLIPAIGEVVGDLIATNRRIAPPAADRDQERGSPLFRRGAPRRQLVGGPMDDFALHLTANDFTVLLMGAVKKLKIVSPRTGRPLKITTRRLRYSFATRLVRESASQVLVADLLDHTDLQNVQCYFDVKSDIVASLDRAMAMSLAPIAQAFLGKLVRSENEAVRGGRKESRVFKRPGETTAPMPIGTCGSFSFCGMFAPVACYTCTNFQPWVEAPHREVLEDLLADRERKRALGLDGRMIAVNDLTIAAVAEVVLTIEKLRTGEDGHVGRDPAFRPGPVRA